MQLPHNLPPMETRTIEETKIFYLSLADMRGWVDRILPVVAFEELSRLEEWMEAQKEPWTDLNEDGTKDEYGKTHKYQKTYKKGSPLEWYNPPENMEPIEHPTWKSFVWFTWLRKTDNKSNPYDLKIPFNPLPYALCTQSDSHQKNSLPTSRISKGIDE